MTTPPTSPSSSPRTNPPAGPAAAPLAVAAPPPAAGALRPATNVVARFGHGVLTVARQEIRLRIRTGRWRWLLAAWFIVTGAVTGGVWLLVTKVNRDINAVDPHAAEQVGLPMYGALMLFVLGLGLLVVPALTAQSINGDRERGVLATLQVTLLRPAEIAIGKLVAAWGVAVVFLVLTLPWMAWSYLEGGVRLAQIAVVLLVVALLLGVFCATSLGLSSVLARTTTSGVLSYLAVFFAVVGTLMVFGIGVGLTTENRDQRVPVNFDQQGQVSQYATEHVSVPRPDRVWWLLAPNPFVVLADAAPAAPRVVVGHYTDESGKTVAQYENPRYDILSAMGNAVREVRKDPVGEVLAGGRPTPGGPLWPTGITVDVLIGAAMVWLTARRLRTPAAKLARGQRVA